MKNLLGKLPFIFVIIYFVILQMGCNGKDHYSVIVPKLSPADKIAGFFGGTGKYLPGNISLGNMTVCQAAPLDYQSKYQSKESTVNITKLTDTTVTISFLTGPYPVDKYTPVTVREVDDMISFGSLGFYDTNTRVLLVSGVAPNFGYSTLMACQVGIPFYTAVIVSPPPGTGLIGYFTIKRYEFSGSKQ